MRRAFVTGATGFVGLNLIERLLAHGFAVTALHRAGSDLTYLGRLPASRVTGAIEDAESILQAMPQGVDVVFHTAASLTWWRPAYAAQHQTNVVGTRNVARAALQKGAKRFVHTSSIAAYGIQAGRIDEETPSTAADSPIGYLRTKHLAEAEVRAAIADGLSAVILNPVNIIGPYDARQWGRIFRMISTGSLPGIPGGGGEFCHVGHVVDAHIAAIDRGGIGENYLLGGVAESYFEMAKIVARLVGKRPPKIVPMPVLWVVARFAHLKSLVTRKEPDLTPHSVQLLRHSFLCSSAKAQGTLGYPTTHNLESMLTDAHRWLVSEGLLARA